MKFDNVVKSLVYEDEVLLTVIDGTVLAKDGIQTHGLSGGAAYAFTESLLFASYLSVNLKNEKGAVSLSVKSADGLNVAVSGNALGHIRGFIDYPIESNTHTSGFSFSGGETFSVIRDEGFGLPFVGTFACIPGTAGENFEEYFRVSEQLPTRFASLVCFSENNTLVYAGLIALQPLPFARSETLAALPDTLSLKNILSEVFSNGLQTTVINHFSANNDRIEVKSCEYKCNCSKAYLSSVLMSVGKPELKKIIKEEGFVKIHCHYCNTDYVFDEKDIENL